MYVTSNILSYLDFKLMVAAIMVSKTWYNLMSKHFEDVQKNHETLRLAGCFSHGKEIEKKSWVQS